MSSLAEIEEAVETLPPKEQHKLLQHLAARLGMPKPLPQPRQSAHDLMKDGCGIVDSGKRDLGSNKKHLSGYGR